MASITIRNLDDDVKNGMRPVHPGEILQEDLDALGMSAAELARRIEVPANRIAGILKGRQAGGETSWKLP